MTKLDKKFGLVILAFQLAMIICFAKITTYNDDDEAKNCTTPNYQNKMNHYYSMFQDVQIMILVGFGMLMTFLKKYCYSGVSLNFLISAVTFQYAIICSRIEGPVKINIETLDLSVPIFYVLSDRTFLNFFYFTLVDADVLTAAILISLGAVLGKVTPLQILLMVIVETPILVGNKYFSNLLQVVDVGGSITIHTFGTYFGLAVSRIISKPKNTKLELSSYNSDMFSIIGALFLWVFWPSFNSISSSSDKAYERAILNTYLSLTASCIICFALSSLTDVKYKFNMNHVQNATLAGGVAIGTVADLKIPPWTSILIGSIAGAICVIGFVYIQPWLLKYCSLHDTCGINNLHGMTSILAAVVAAITAGQASKELYGDEFEVLFPAMGSHGNNGILDATNRTAGMQAAYQILVLVLTLMIAITGGSIAGILIKLGTQVVGYVPDEFIYDDNFLFSDVDDNESSFNKRISAVNIISESIN
ncbi:ammonium transporter Rh type A [Cimex lectularius]|uniref:Ammonium transporter AmtB-like domain-containing protein n=1 Tax=Cimex lectularius TaxID=79782 RepID=A0A8I6R7E7_CIMLE|nr:ammonium transporter Rh type A [Cimex lectularius]XP_014239864.1 ammonium transporter Rh type A [Cimex lectularius]